ncbi:MAG TPA: GDSL-type esterase/lipase family protein [Agriterribacter sp.]|nr:GDSL-type esterase/lipase family protein [Agriterribacter sp.]
MKIKFFPLFLLIHLGCSTTQINTSGNVLPATSLEPYGRYIWNDQKKLELISSGVHFGFSFYGNSCSIYATLPETMGHNYLQYELDGVFVKRIKLEAGSKEPIVISAGTTGKHTVWIYKATEAHTGAIVIEQVTGKNIQAIKPKNAPLIEFIGNSITCGAAADPSEVPCGSGAYHDQHNAYYAYGPRVARALGTHFILSSVSGIGMYRNWNSDGPNMLQVYEKTGFHEGSLHQWNFSAYSPDIVSIALGTNDLSNGDGKKERLPFDSSQFVNNYIRFVQLVHSKYPKAQVALLSSAMVHDEKRTVLENCLAAVKQHADSLHTTAKPLALYLFKPMQARGCSGHPNVEDHAMLANELVPFFRALLP